MATRLPGRAFHPDRYVDANDPDGATRARKAGWQWMDIDFQRCLGLWIAAHWSIPALEGFRFTAASVAAGAPAKKVGRLCWRPYRAMRWEMVVTLRTRDGRRIQTGRDALRRAAAAGRSVEADVKVRPSRKQLRALASLAEAAYGERWQRRVIVKRSARIPGWRKTLRRASSVGFTTAVLRHSGRDLPRFVDHFRP